MSISKPGGEHFHAAIRLKSEPVTVGPLKNSHMYGAAQIHFVFASQVLSCRCTIS